MSRVDDDHQSRKLIEQLALKKANEQKRAQGQQGENAFSKRLQTAKPQEFQQTTEKRSLAQEAFERLRAQGGAGTSATAQQARERPTVMGGRTQQAEQQQTTTKGQDEGARLTQTQQQGSQNAEVRREGNQETHTRSEERGQELQSSDRSGALAADGKAAALRADSDRQSGGGGGAGGDGQRDQGGNQKEGAAAALSFRFNPALMAPAPLARPRDTATSDRLRAMANEIAQKIVERVRVGTNASGASEFQIDLRSNVLSGLSIKISARNGRIHAAFRGSDRNVMQLLKENAEQLRTTLSARGLTLGDVTFEDRA